MFSVLVGALGALALALPAAAQVTPFPGDFRTQEITTDDGATIHIRVGGQGPAVVLLHGFGDTGDMWAPLAAELARDHTVVVPDLRGMGLSSHPADGYDKRTQAADVRAVLTHLGIDWAAIVGHDLGTMVAYAYAARYPDTTEKLVVMDAPVPGIPPLGRPRAPSPALAFLLRWPGCRAACRWTRAHVSRSLLERVRR